PYKNGIKEGIDKTYYESGKLWIETPFKNDKKEGFQYYYKSGVLFAVILYVNNEITSGICANGRLWTSAELINWENGLQVYCRY
ncbi:MAG: hypothetical protein K2N67_06730, partial [Mucispirillum sp.]|nr:hypothetical protein [Mucispirillum sp.]